MALASYVAAGIANADINKVGWTALTYGMTCYILPFIFVFGPALMLNGSFGEIAFAVSSGTVGVYAIAVSVIGYARSPLTIGPRALAALSGIALLHQSLVSDLAGILGVGFVIFLSRTVQHKA